ncbi:hypothetical protein BJF84_21830 [Rhodococcus sp. CUA-806]|nr:hypothetical protein BJF84_21830 [Rhodococcus sp. CUA-806]
MPRIGCNERGGEATTHPPEGRAAVEIGQFIEVEIGIATSYRALRVTPNSTERVEKSQTGHPGSAERHGM